MLLRLERLHISPEDLARPIPSLTKRQFIVAKNKQSASQERLARELFWYREALLERISASWNEVRRPDRWAIADGTRSEASDTERSHSGICGSPSRCSTSCAPMRSRSFSDWRRMLPPIPTCSGSVASPTVLSTPRAQTTLWTSAPSSSTTRVCLSLLSSTDSRGAAHSLHLLLQLELLPPDVHTTPAALAHLSRYVVVDSFSSIPLAVLGPGESTEARISLCLLAEGRYEFGCFVEELRTTEEATRDGERESRPYRSQPLVVEVDC